MEFDRDKIKHIEELREKMHRSINKSNNLLNKETLMISQELDIEIADLMICQQR